jgi:hypothetical protein
MKWLALLLAITGLSGCKRGSEAGGTGASDVTYHAPVAEEAEPAPSYGKPELQRALIAERGAEAAAERHVAELETSGDPDQVRVARDDLSVRRRFIASLEVCEAMGRYCPPRLDDPEWTYPPDAETDPKLETALRFDLESWKKVAAELHGRACACRTLSCVDSLGAAIDRLETRPMAEVQGDDEAIASITRARDCLFRLRGKRSLPRLATE